MKYNNINFNHKNILITGGAGFIGSNLALYFQYNYPKSHVVVFDCFRDGSRHSNGNLRSFGHYKNLLGFTGEIICGDISIVSDIEKLSQYNFDYIFHQAAISDTRIYDQEMVMKTNVNSFYSILEKARSDNSVLVYASSAATYGNLSSPQTLNITNPENPYGFSKYMMDQIAFRFSNDNPNLKIVGLRFFNVYGPREYYKEKTASMIIQLGHQLLSQSRPKLFENSKNIYRDFVYIEDVIQAIVKSCNSKKNGTFNIGTGIPRSFLDVVNILQNELQTNFEVEYILNPYKGYQNHTQADISESTLNFDYSPSFSLEEGIKSYIPEIIRLHEE